MWQAIRQGWVDRAAKPRAWRLFENHAAVERTSRVVAQDDPAVRSHVSRGRLVDTSIPEARTRC